MAQNPPKEQSHLGFFVALLVVVAAAFGAYKLFGNYIFTTQQQVQTVVESPGGATKIKPKEREPEAKADAASEKPAAPAAPGASK
jgi:hypothetical protein